jgi:hypothetical protein
LVGKKLVKQTGSMDELEKNGRLKISWWYGILRLGSF